MTRMRSSQQVVSRQYLLLLLVVALLLCAHVTEGKLTTGNNKSGYEKKFVKELFATNVTNNLQDWDSDMAITFYAPWCKYCKQILPYWEAIAEMTQSNKDITVGKFNCESPAENAELCHKLGVDRYPSIYFVGYGNYHQPPKGKNPFAKNPHPNVVRYTADLYPEALLDWIQMLSFISKVKRRWSDFVGVFTGSTRMQTRMRNLERRLLLSEKRSYTFGKELEKYKALEIFNEMEDYGDPFPLLSEMDPDDVSTLNSLSSHFVHLVH